MTETTKNTLEGTVSPTTPAPEPGRTDATSSSSPQWTTTKLRHETAGLRDEAQLLKSDVDEMHHDAQRYDLTVRASLKARQGHQSLLTELSEIRGMGWGDIATALGVSLSAVRKWRSGGTCTPENRTSLARLAALLDLADEASIEEAAGWLLTEVEHGYRTRFIDMIAAGAENLVLDCALMRLTAREALDRFDSSWRENTVRAFDVVTDDDGVRSLQRR